MFCSSRSALNFYPLGRRGGPVNKYLRYGVQNNTTSRTWGAPPKTIVSTTRDRLTLDCPMCTFKWDFETLTVNCPSVEAHNKREHWLAADWVYKGEQAEQYYRSMPVTFNPRTHQFMADGQARAKNNERRAQGLTTKNRMIHKQQTGMARDISGIGTFANRWETHFPYPG